MTASRLPVHEFSIINGMLVDYKWLSVRLASLCARLHQPSRVSSLPA
jgi:hypothetical protein